MTNDIFTKEDGEFLVRHQALPPERIAAVETGGCPHTAVRDDVSQNLDALGQLMVKFGPDLLFVESGGDNLAAQFSRELADFTIYVIDVSGGDKIPRKGGPGITQSDLLVINKTDLAPLVGADLDVMARDSRRMRGDGPFVFAQVTNGIGVTEIADHLQRSWRRDGVRRVCLMPRELWIRTIAHCRSCRRPESRSSSPSILACPDWWPGTTRPQSARTGV